MKTLIAAVLLLAAPLTARAANLNDHTPCSVMPVAGRDTVTPDRILELKTYILNTMDNLDTRHIEAGEPGVMSNLSDAGEVDMAAATAVHCHLHPKLTIFNSAAFVYRGVRDIEMQFGTAK